MNSNKNFEIIIMAVIVCVVSLLLTKAIWGSSLPEWLKLWLLI